MAYKLPVDTKRKEELMKQLPISRIRQFLSLDPKTPVRLYSFQKQDTWDRAIAKGYWTGHNHFSDPENILEGEKAYRYIQEKMALTVPSFSGDFPMFAWLKRPSSKPKPYISHGSGGEIRLTVLVPRERIVISDFELFCCALFQNPCLMSHQEEEDFNLLFPGHWSYMSPEQQDEYFSSIKETWNKIFEFNPTTDPETISFGGSPKYFRVQACVDRFYWDEIVDVRKFDPQRYRKRQ